MPRPGPSLRIRPGGGGPCFPPLSSDSGGAALSPTGSAHVLGLFGFRPAAAWMGWGRFPPPPGTALVLGLFGFRPAAARGSGGVALVAGPGFARARGCGRRGGFGTRILGVWVPPHRWPPGWRLFGFAGPGTCPFRGTDPEHGSARTPLGPLACLFGFRQGRSGRAGPRAFGDAGDVSSDSSRSAPGCAVALAGLLASPSGFVHSDPYPPRLTSCPRSLRVHATVLRVVARCPAVVDSLGGGALRDGRALMCCPRFLSPLWKRRRPDSERDRPPLPRRSELVGPWSGPGLRRNGSRGGRARRMLLPRTADREGVTPRPFEA